MGEFLKEQDGNKKDQYKHGLCESGLNSGSRDSIEVTHIVCNVPDVMPPL